MPSAGPTAEPYLRVRGLSQALRHLHRARRHRPRHRRGRVRLVPRALGLRQDDAAARHLRPRRADGRHDPPGRPGHLDPAGRRARFRHRLPVLRAVPQPHDPRQCRLRPRRRPAAARPRSTSRVAELLTLVGLADQAEKYPAQLSGGQQQRVALARALALSPGLLLLDEPLSALDARVRARLRGEIRDLQRRLGITTIMVTHDQEEALTMSDRIVVMNQGRIDQVGTPDEIYGQPATAFVADFVGKMNFLPGRLLSDRHGPRSQGAKLDFRRAGALRPGHAGDRLPAARGRRAARRRRADRQRARGAQVGVMEFIGNHFATTLHAAGTSLNVAADLSMNDVRDLGIAARAARSPSACRPSGCASSRPPVELVSRMAAARPSGGEPGAAAPGAGPRRQAVTRWRWALLGLWLVVTVLLPLWALLSKAFQSRDGGFVGLANFRAVLRQRRRWRPRSATACLIATSAR